MSERFEAHEQEIPEISPQTIINIDREIQEDRELADYLLTKIQQKLAFKDAVAVDDGTNDYYEWKRLGMFIVHDHTLPDKLVTILQRNGLDIYSDEVLELHIPPQEANLDTVTKSLDRLREYLHTNSRQRNIPRFIFGISYLATMSKLWGFEVIDLPNEIKENSGAATLLKKYSESENSKKRKIAERFSIDDIKLCYMSVDDLFRQER